MTKNKDIILLSLLEKERTLLEISEIIYSRNKVETNCTLIKCRYCMENNIRNYGLVLKNFTKERNIPQNIKKDCILKYKINECKIPELRCSYCGKRLLKYDKENKLITICKRNYIFELPYKKRKYLLPNLKNNEIRQLKGEGLIGLKDSKKYYLKEKEFYKYIFSEMIHGLVLTDKKDWEHRIGNNLPLCRVLVKKFYLAYNMGLEKEGLKISTIDVLIQNIILSLSDFKFGQFENLIANKNLKIINKMGKKDLKSLWFTVNMLNVNKSEMRKNVFLEAISN
ncbi:hypothetical protein HN903_02080 [archaeon]|jgi:hypothetical protein|nr:hypothetical protein [archaeon]MBT7128521.1 hypothetical protein [archaeon]